MQSPDLSLLSQSLQTLIVKGDTRHYRKATVLINEGDVGGTLFIIVSGRVKVFSVDKNDREVTYGTYGSGEFVGEMSLDDGPRSASVITTEPTICSVVTRATLTEHIAQHPEFAFELLRKVIARARLATHTAKSLALSSVYARVAELFNRMAVPLEDGTRRIEERLTHAEIASRVGSSREMISRLMKDLEQGGYVTGRGYYVLLKVLPSRW